MPIDAGSNPGTSEVFQRGGRHQGGQGLPRGKPPDRRRQTPSRRHGETPRPGGFRFAAGNQGLGQSRYYWIGSTHSLKYV